MQKKSNNFQYILQKQSGLLFVSLAAIYLSVSCQVKPYAIMPGYEEFIENKSLIITALQSSDIQISDEIEEAFGENITDSIYISFFEENLENNLSRVSSFADVKRSPDKADDLRAMEFILADHDTTYFYLPIDNSTLSFQNNKPSDFILFLSGLEVAPSWIDIEYGQNPDIRHTIYYLFWDNLRHQIVCYGKTSYTAGLSKNDKHSFQLLINNLAKSLIENTPFRKILNQW